MDKVRKWMTAAAFVVIALAVLVFAYLPIRNTLRQWSKEEVPLSDGSSGREGEEAEVSRELEKEGISNDFYGEWGNREEKELYGQPEIFLGLNLEEGKQQVRIWGDGEKFYFFLPEYAKEAKFTLESCLDGGGLMVNGRMIREGDGITQVMWETWYQVSFLDKEGEVSEEGSLMFLTYEELPTMVIHTESGSMDLIHGEKGKAESGTMTVYDRDGSLMYDEKLSEVKGRGNSTWGLDKKPYLFKLKDSRDLFGFGKAKSFILLANGYDETGLRNFLVTDLARTLELPYTPEGTFVALYMNGEYYGNYYLCEKIQVGEDRINIRDQGEEFERVYQGIGLEKLKRETSEITHRKWVALSYTPEDITGGYLIERELYERYEVETISGFRTRQGDYYAIQSPEYADLKQVDYIGDLMQKIQDAVEEEDGIHPETGQHYSEYIDLNSFVRKYLVEEVSKNYDGGVTSSFFYKPADSVSKKLFAGPVWDYDMTFGNCGLDEINSNPMGVTRLNDHVLGTGLYARLYEQEDFRQEMIRCYEEEVVPWMKAMLEGQIDEYGERYRKSMVMNNIRWQDLSNRFEYYSTYDDNIRYLKYFMEERMNYLNEVWLEEQIYHCITLEVDGYPWKKIYVKDGETGGVLPAPRRMESVESTFMGWYREGNPLLYDEYKPVYEDLTFVARWHESDRGQEGES